MHLILLNATILSAKEDLCKSAFGAWKQVRSEADEKTELTAANSTNYHSESKYLIKLKSLGNKIEIIFTTGSNTYAFTYTSCKSGQDSITLINPKNPSRLKRNVILFKNGLEKICLDDRLGGRGTATNPDCFIRLTSQELKELGNLFNEDSWE